MRPLPQISFFYFFDAAAYGVERALKREQRVPAGLIDGTRRERWKEEREEEFVPRTITQPTPRDPSTANMHKSLADSYCKTGDLASERLWKTGLQEEERGLSFPVHATFSGAEK